MERKKCDLEFFINIYSGVRKIYIYICFCFGSCLPSLPPKQRVC